LPSPDNQGELTDLKDEIVRQSLRNLRLSNDFRSISNLEANQGETPQNAQSMSK
jgi:hypothetical protein